MSSILEALKKLEDEKSARLSGSGNIAGKVVKTGRRPGQRPGWLLPTGMAVAATIAAVITYMFMGGFSAGKRNSQLQLSAPLQQPQSFLTSPAVPTPPPDLPPVTVHEKILSSSPASPVARQAPAPNAAPQRQVEERQNDEKHAVFPQPAALPTLPSLKVTGIGWQKDNADRLAVVNGRAVSEGAVIEGARVEEIFPDRVRFSFEGRTVEIPLGKNPGENP